METSQLQLFLDEGVDLNRVAVGHTAWHLMDAEERNVCIEWMERGASFLPTTLDVNGDQDWRPLIEAIHGIFEVGLGDKILFGLDHGYVSESRPFAVAPFMPPPPFLYMFTDVLPAFRKLGLNEKEEETIMVKNPQRILPIK